MGKGKLSQSSFINLHLQENLPAMREFVHQRMGPKLRGRESTSDILQSAIREMLRQKSVDREALRGLFFTIAKNKIIDRLRFWSSEKRDPKKETSRLFELMARGEAEPIPEKLIAREAQSHLEKSLQQLPAEHFEIIQRVRLDGESVASVAHSTGRSEKAVRSLLYRALSRLAKELERS